MKKVEIYTLDYCPFCMKAKAFLENLNVDYEEIPCENDEDNMRQELTERFNLKELATFPQIIIDGVNIGGYSDLVDKYDSGEISFE